MTERIRQRLGEAVLGDSFAMEWGAHSHREPTLGVRESRAPDSGGEPKSIAMLDL